MAGETPVTEVRKGGMVAEKACLQQQPNLNFSALLQSRRLRGLEMRFIVLLCAAALLLAVPVSLNAEQLTDSNTAPSAAEAELLSLANAWTEAINAKNRSKLQEPMAPEFSCTHGTTAGKWQEPSGSKIFSILMTSRNTITPRWCPTFTVMSQ